ncbi:superinfection immunity protein [Paraburkholderia sp. UCT2]|uniref:superinfection immunity protein n=1 Tax=Paraburkholderia sp. UCT2 TaxID=2615208 RepID=UPI001655CD1C|nr:superinfection immunity protein [Paraburkholderia sp. UCT2]MBC8728876.1 superinfection immunity protein [Paraburkholderia sp. UCT2]
MGGNVAVQAIGAAFALALYFLPAIIADRRKRRDVLTLALFNACLGWTILGWVLALYWALQPNPAESLARDVVETRKVSTLRAFSSALTLRVRRREAARERHKR